MAEEADQGNSVNIDPADRRRLILRISVVLALSATFSGALVKLSDDQHMAEERSAVERIAELHLRRLDQNIHQALSATYAVAALVRQGNGAVPDFDATARQMLALYPGVSALQLAPGGVVTHSVPLEGNEKAIGHDLLADSDRNKEAILARNTGRLTLAGPFPLVQGGEAAVGRLPIYLPSAQGASRFWGFASAMIRFPEALKTAGLMDLQRDGYEFSLWRIHPDSGKAQVIAASTRNISNPIELRMSVPNGEWMLSVAPSAGWGGGKDRLFRMFAGGVFTLLLTFAAAIHLRQPLVLQAKVARATQALREREARLESMNELSSDWYWVTDGEHRFVSLTSGIERIVGLTPEGLIGRHRWDLPTTLTIGEWNAHRAVLDARGEFRDFQYGVHLDSGDVRYISVSGRPRYDGDRFVGYHGTGRNITARRRAEQDLIESEKRFQLLFEQAPVAMSVTSDVDGFAATRWNAAWLRTFGYEPEFAQGKSGRDIGLWSIPLDRNRYIEAATQHGDTRTQEFRMRRADGAERLVEVAGCLIEAGTRRILVTSYEDISERREAEIRLRDSLQRLELHVSATPLAVIDWDAEYRVVSWNPAAEKIFGYSRDEAIGQHASFIVPERYRHRVDGIMKALFTKSGGHRSTNPNVTKDGQVIECEWYNAPITSGDGSVVSLSSLVLDVTERAQHMRALEHLAHHDPLTGLLNRNWLSAEIDRRINETPGLAFNVLFVDLDRFKEINDTLGHQIGDELLVKIASRLHGELAAKECLVARLGGDEFAILASEGMPEMLAQEILQILREPINLSGMNLELGAGVGIAHYPQHGGDTASLMRCADIAMYHAKKMAQGYATYSAEIDVYSQDHLALMNDLRSAIRNDELVLYYQPKIDIRNHRLIGHEALLRWQHPGRGMVPPNRFIPHAELTDMMQPLTLWVIEAACRQWRQWADLGTTVSIAINLSSRNLLEDRLPENVGMLLGTYEVDPSFIEFEITESAVMADPEKAMTILHRLRNLGVSLSIDDFGTGYSSLGYLRRLPVQKLKIDASFVMGMQHNREDCVIVESTIGLAHSLGLKVVAEGVENAEVLGLLRNLGCEEAQGYYFSRPAPAASFTDWLPPR